MKLKENEQEAIIQRIEFIRQELSDLEEYRNLDYPAYQANRKDRRNVERIAENICNAVIDIATRSC